MSNKSIERAFQFDYGIENIIDRPASDAALPKERVMMRPGGDVRMPGIDTLLQSFSVENFIKSGIAPVPADEDWLFPRRFRQGLKEILHSLKHAGSRGDAWRQTVGALEANDRLLELLILYQNTLHKA